jgi:SSS family solute:Na+ symporter
MLTLINTTYYGVTQFFPGMMAILFGWRIRPLAVALGIACGQALAIALYISSRTLAASTWASSAWR